jgi:hypothetical protein
MMIAAGVLRPNVHGDPTRATWIDQPTLRLDKLALRQVRAEEAQQAGWSERARR